MWKFAGALAICLVSASPALSANVFFEDFDAENGGSTALNYTPFGQFTVDFGNVDLVANGFAGLTGNGSFVDLDGSGLGPNGAAGALIRSSSSFSFVTGETVSLSFLVSGSQRGDANEFSFGFETTGGNILFKNVLIGGSLSPGVVAIGDLGPGPALASGRPSGGLGAVASAEPYSPYSITFTAGNDGTVTFFFASSSEDDFGVLLDNVSLDIAAAAIPEPASWAMMIAGFGLIGAAARRTRPTALA